MASNTPTPTPTATYTPSPTSTPTQQLRSRERPRRPGHFARRGVLLPDALRLQLEPAPRDCHQCGEFTDCLRTISARKLLVLLDCCHAGGVSEAKSSGLGLTKSPLLPPEAHRLLEEGRGRVLVASSQENELSFAGRPYPTVPSPWP